MSKSKDLIKQKKDGKKMKGMDVKQDSKYTGRWGHNKEKLVSMFGKLINNRESLCDTCRY